MRSNTAKSGHDIALEVNRYFVWPGQTIAYKIGQLKIRELRTCSETKLGVGFDERAYHDAILASTSVPLDFLKRYIKWWVE